MQLPSFSCTSKLLVASRLCLPALIRVYPACNVPIRRRQLPGLFSYLVAERGPAAICLMRQELELGTRSQEAPGARIPALASAAGWGQAQYWLGTVQPWKHLDSWSLGQLGARAAAGSLFQLLESRLPASTAIRSGREVGTRDRQHPWHSPDTQLPLMGMVLPTQNRV